MNVDHDYETYLDRLVDDLFEIASQEFTWAELAAESRLAYTTVARLGNRQTRLPQLRTVYRLAEAVGYDLSLIKREIKKRKAA